MLENMKFKSRNGSGSLAAAYLIFAVGLVGAAVVTALSFHEYPEVPIFVLVIGGVLAVLTIVLRMRPDLPSQALWLFSCGRRGTDCEYTPELIKPHGTPTDFGTNQPPTADDIREIKESPMYWVPTRSRNGRKSLKD